MTTTLPEIGWLILALVIPWSLGTGLVASIVPNLTRGQFALMAGIGFPLGIYLAAASTYAALALGVGAGTRPVLLLMLALAIAVWAGPGRCAVTKSEVAPVPARNSLVGLALSGAVGLVVLVPVIADQWLRPVFPWDAWYSYALKARLMFELDRLPELVRQDEWLRWEKSGGYLLSRAHTFTIPAIQTWIAGAIGRWSESLVNLPWAGALLSLGLVTHGLIKSVTRSPCLAAAGFSLMVTTPAFGVHTVLAGYLDIWLATWLVILAVAVYWAAMGLRREPIIAGSVAILACVATKDTGVVYVAALLAAGLLALLRPAARLALLGLLIMAGVSFALYLQWDPGPALYVPVGESDWLGIKAGELRLPFLRDFHLGGPYAVWPELLDSLMFSPNFGLLGWLVTVVGVGALAAAYRSREATVLSAFLLLTGMAFHFGFGYTGAGALLGKGTVDLRILIPVVAVGGLLSLVLASRLLVCMAGAKEE